MNTQPLGITRESKQPHGGALLAGFTGLAACRLLSLLLKVMIDQLSFSPCVCLYRFGSFVVTRGKKESSCWPGNEGNFVLKHLILNRVGNSKLTSFLI